MLACAQLTQNIVVLLRPRIGEVVMKPEACEESLVLCAAGNGIPAPSAESPSAFNGGVGSAALKRSEQS